MELSQRFQNIGFTEKFLFKEHFQELEHHMEKKKITPNLDPFFSLFSNED